MTKETLKKAISNKLIVQIKYKDKDGITTDKVIEPFAIGLNIKNNLDYFSYYQTGGQSTSNKDTPEGWHNGIINHIIEIILTETKFDPYLRKDFNPDNPISKIKLSPESVFKVDFVEDTNKDSKVSTSNLDSEDRDELISDSIKSDDTTE